MPDKTSLNAHNSIGQFIAALESDETVQVRGFGTFAVQHKPAREVRNPRNGEMVQAPAKRRISVKTHASFAREK